MIACPHCGEELQLHSSNPRPGEAPLVTCLACGKVLPFEVEMRAKKRDRDELIIQRYENLQKERQEGGY